MFCSMKGWARTFDRSGFTGDPGMVEGFAGAGEKVGNGVDYFDTINTIKHD